jgi:hypothetical protein
MDTVRGSSAPLAVAINWMWFRILGSQATSPHSDVVFSAQIHVPRDVHPQDPALEGRVRIQIRVVQVPLVQKNLVKLDLVCNSTISSQKTKHRSP